jgi:hydrogenase maturation protease
MTATLTAPVVRLLVCGNADRGDDGVALVAAARLVADLSAEVSPRVEIRRCLDLRTEDLLELPDGVGVVIIDAVQGPRPGVVVRLPVRDLASRPPFTPRSSHELPIDLVVGLAGALRQRPVDGVFVGLAGSSFGFGSGLSAAARSGLPAFRAAVLRELEGVAGRSARDASTARSAARRTTP